MKHAKQICISIILSAVNTLIGQQLLLSDYNHIDGKYDERENDTVSYTLRAPANGTISYMFDCGGSNLIYRGPETVVAYEDFSVGVARAADEEAGGHYYIEVTFTPDSAGPTFTSQPTSQTAVAGGAVTFTGTASGVPTPSLIWQRSVAGSSTWATITDGGGYSGTTTGSLTVAGVSTGMNADRFRCVAANSSGVASSDVAVLSVSNQPAGVPRYQWSTLIGTPAPPWGGATAPVWYSWAVAIDSEGNAIIADAYSHTIKKLTRHWENTPVTWEISILAGSAGNAGCVDGNHANARFNFPCGIAIDKENNIFVVDRDNHRIRKITPDGLVSTFAGQDFGPPGFINGTGSAAMFGYMQGITIDSQNNLYVAEHGYNTIRKITQSAVVTTFAGPGASGISGHVDGPSASALFNIPRAVAADQYGNIYVAEAQYVRKISPSGIVTTVAGGTTGHADGTGSSAQFVYINGIVADTGQNIYLVDAFDQTIRHLTPSGVVTTIGSQWNNNGNIDGIGAAASFVQPYGVSLGFDGGLYVVCAFHVRHGVPNIAILAAPDTVSTQISGSPTQISPVAFARSQNLSSIDTVTLEYSWNGGSWTPLAGNPFPHPYRAAESNVITLNQTGVLSLRAASSAGSGLFETTKDVIVNGAATRQPSFIIANTGSYNYGPTFMLDGIDNACRVWWTGSPPSGGDAIYYKTFSNNSAPVNVFNVNSFNQPGQISDPCVIRLSGAIGGEYFTLNSGNYPHSAYYGNYTYAMYYTEAESIARWNQIAVAFSNDGITWTPGKPVVYSQDTTQHQGFYGAGYPSVIVIGSGVNRRFCMFNIDYSYSASAPQPIGRNHGVECFFRTSTDGVNWVGRSAVPDPNSQVFLVSLDGIDSQHSIVKGNFSHYNNRWYISYSHRASVYVFSIAMDPVTYAPTGAWDNPPLGAVGPASPLSFKSGEGLMRNERGHLPSGLIWPVYSAQGKLEDFRDSGQLYYAPLN